MKFILIRDHFIFDDEVVENCFVHVVVSTELPCYWKWLSLVDLYELMTICYVMKFYPRCSNHNKHVYTITYFMLLCEFVNGDEADFL